MPNQYLNPLDDEEDKPYSSLSNRPQMEGTGAPNPAVKEMIMKRMASQLPVDDSISTSQSSASPPDIYSGDPLMKQYDQEQKDLDAYRQAKIGGDAISNLGQAAAQLAQGVNTPQVNSGLYQNIQKQNEGLLQSKEGDLDRRSRVINAIEARKMRAEDAKLRRDEMNSNRDLMRADRKAKEARPSEKEIEAFTDLDNAESDLNNLVSSLGENSNWVGPIDGRIPDMLVGEDQAAWRSALGKYKDAYRKAITGAGAGPTEIALLEKRLPKETDTLSNFKAKVREAQNEIKRRREIKAKNLERGGKDVRAFTSPQSEVSNSGKIVVSDGNETLTIDPADLADAEKDGFKRL